MAVAEELHFRRAAERLNMTQPPLSRQIQKLEQDIQVKLFERDARRVTLTPAGAAFLEDARRLLQLAASAPDLAKRIAEGAAGTVRIGFTGASTYAVLGPLLNLLGARLPDINIDLSELVTSEQLEALAGGTIDLGFARPPFDAELYDSMLIQQEALVVAMPTTHRLAELTRPLTGEDLSNENFITHSPIKAKYFYDLTASVLSTHVRTVHTVTQVLTMVLLVAAHRGIAVVPASASTLGVDGLHFAPLHTANPKPVELHAIWPRGSRNPALHKVRALLGEILVDAD